MGALMVEAVDEEVTVRWAVGRRLTREGGSSMEEVLVPSKGEGEGAGEGDGMFLSCCTGMLLSSCTAATLVALGRRLGDCGGVSSSSALVLLALLTCLEGEAGMPRLLPGLAKGLDGRSEAWWFWLIWDGRRTKGLVFSGDNELVLVGERCEGPLMGDEPVGVVARTVGAGDAEFWRRKGDWRPESLMRSDEGRTDMVVVLSLSIVLSL